MSALEEACLLSCEQWVDSFSQIPKHKFSKEHNKAIEKIIYPDKKDYHINFSKKSVKILLIAAILLSFATTVFAIPTCREHILNKFSNHSEYSVTSSDKAKDVKSLDVNYVPNGFKIFEKDTNKFGYIYEYRHDEKIFTVEKIMIDIPINFDTEKYGSEEIEINGIRAICYRSDDDIYGIIFNNGEYIFSISGNLSKDELVKIAQNVE